MSQLHTAVVPLAGDQVMITRRLAIQRVAGVGATLALATTASSASFAVAQEGTPMPDATPASGSTPTIVLVHGAFAESASWNGVIPALLAQGYQVVAAANPLRSIQIDAEYIAGLLAGTPGPIVLVGHSYGGAVITNAAAGNPNVKALVYVAGFALDDGESAAVASALAPGSTLGETLAPVPLPGGGSDLYIDQTKFHSQFAVDLPADEAALMAVTQRPATDAALNDPSGPPAWQTIPSWFIYGELDKNIPAAAHALMAERAGARQSVQVPGASHVVMISHPTEVADMILTAALAAV